MIRYDITQAELANHIEVEVPGWFRRATRRTNKFKKVGRYSEKSSIWSEIKTVYMRLQHDKCAYCERKLAGEKYGPAEHDMEHFRPKSSVSEWPTAEIRAERPIRYHYLMGGASATGYHRLAYSTLNYVTACKPCNQPLKRDHFPVAGARSITAETVAEQLAEEAYLIFPIGDHDEDPQDVLTFDGMLPVPVRKSGRSYRRAKVIIDFFDLAREDLLRERASIIADMWNAHVVLAKKPTAEEKEFATTRLAAHLSRQGPHTSCAEAFDKLVKSDRAAAKAVAKQANNYHLSQVSKKRL